MADIAVKAVEDWIGMLSDDRLVFKVAPCPKELYYHSLQTTMFIIAMQTIPNRTPPLMSFVDNLFRGFTDQELKMLPQFRKEWTPNVIPVWTGSTDIPDADKPEAKWEHLVATKKAFDFLKKKLMEFTEPLPLSRPILDDSPDWVYEEEDDPDLMEDLRKLENVK